MRGRMDKFTLYIARNMRAGIAIFITILFKEIASSAFKTLSFLMYNQ
jgi:hypothetical protein